MHLLTEGRCTGVLKIRNAMKSNGSPPPIFKTDENHSFFLVTLPIHPEASRKMPILDGNSLLIDDETHQLEEISAKDNLPSELKLKLDNLGKRPENEDLNAMICALCAWSPLTAQ